MFTAARGRIKRRGSRGVCRRPASKAREQRVPPVARPRVGAAQTEEALPWAAGRRPPAAARVGQTAALAAAARSTPSWPQPPAPPSARSPGGADRLGTVRAWPRAGLKLGNGRGGDCARGPAFSLLPLGKWVAPAPREPGEKGRGMLGDVRAQELRARTAGVKAAWPWV